jgi:hypothetical protein
MFYTFSSQDERRAFGGSCFIEIAFCKLPDKTRLKKLVSVNSADKSMRQNDSLYVSAEDMNRFLDDYGNIFNCGTYNNMKTGIVDCFGINYYSPELIPLIIERICENKPEDYEKLIDWLNQAKQCNGFYILGI